MKKFFIISLYIIAAIQIIIPFFNLATVGYDGYVSFFFDIYKCFVPAILAGTLIYLLRKEK